MKRYFILVLFGITVQAVNSQSFLKKLGKSVTNALEKAVQVTDGAASAKGASSQAIPGVTMQVGRVEHWGKGLRVQFSVKNTSASTVIVNFDTDTRSGFHTYANGLDGTVYASAVPAFGTGSAVGHDTKCEVPSGLAVSGVMFVQDVPSRTNALRRIVFGGKYCPPRKTGQAFDDWKNFRYVYDGDGGRIAVSAADNTGAANVSCSLPTLTVRLGKTLRSGTDVVMDYTLTNTSGTDMVLSEMTSMTIYDSEGNAYPAELAYGGNAIRTYGSHKFPAGVPVKGVLTIKNVPSSVSVFSLIRLPLDRNNEYNIEIRNHKVESSGVAAGRSVTAAGPFKGKWFLKSGGFEYTLDINFYAKTVSEYEGGEKVDGCLSSVQLSTARITPIRDKFMV